MKFHSKIFGWEYAWQEFANEQKGAAEIDEHATPSLKKISVPIAQSGNIEFIANPQKHHSHAETIALVEFQPQTDYTLSMHTERWTDHLEKLLGPSHMIQIGDARIDNRFVIHSNDKLKTIEFLGQEKMRTNLLSFHDLTLRTYGPGEKLPTGTKVPPGKYVLCFTQEKLAQSFEELSAIHFLMAAVLAELNTADEAAANYRPSFAERFHG